MESESATKAATINQSHLSFPSASSGRSHFLDSLEEQMKELWSQYVSCLNESGFTEKAAALRAKYYNLYKTYRRDREWKKLISKTDGGALCETFEP